MLKSDYQYALQFYREDRTPLGLLAVPVDLEPACEWTMFAALRKGWIGIDDLGKGASVWPIWHSKAGKPFMEGFHVSIAANGHAPVSKDFTNAYFAETAQQAAAHFVATGELKGGDRFIYMPAAFPRPESRQQDSTDVFTSQEVPPLIKIRSTSLPEIARDAFPQGPMNEELMPAFVPQQVLDEAAEQADKAGAQETGGILIGHIHRDPNYGEMFVVVTAQIAARHTQADLTRLVFTAETWSDVRAAIRLRASDEQWLGWWHSHLIGEWCKDCPEEKRKACGQYCGFLSSHDRALHRTLFPRGYSIALVVNALAAGASTFSMFGWNEGTLESRGFHVIGRPGFKHEARSEDH